MRMKRKFIEYVVAILIVSSLMCLYASIWTFDVCVSGKLFMTAMLSFLVGMGLMQMPAEDECDDNEED